MGHGRDSYILEGGPAASAEKAVYQTVKQSVIDEYNARLLAHIADHPISRDGYWDDDVEPTTPGGTYPKLVGGEVQLLPYDGGPAIPQSEKPPVRIKSSRSSDDYGRTSSISFDYQPKPARERQTVRSWNRSW